MTVYDLQMKIGRGTHDHSASFMLGRVSRTDRIDTDAVDTWARLYDADVIGGAGEEENHLALPFREVTPREDRHIPILADIVVGHDEGAKTETGRATV